MALDPQVAKLRSERIASGARPVSMGSVEEAREEEARSLSRLRRAVRATDGTRPGGPIPLRLYRPAGW